MKRKLLNYVLVAFLILNALLIAVACSDASQKGECEHEFDEWSAIRKRTCTQEQVEVRRCELCGKREKKRTGMLAHEVQIILGKAPTCQDRGLTDGEVCTFCNKVLKEQKFLPRIEHDPKIHEATAPTCSQPGRTGYTTCTYCNEVLDFGQEIPMLDHVEKVIPGQSHNCMEKGMLDGVECDICHTVLVEPAIGYGKHEYKNGECIHCGETENTSKGLWMSYNSYYDGYQVVGIGECTDEHIVIPKLYKGFPVVAIKDMAFRDNRNIKSVVLPDSIVAIGDYAFFQCNNLRSVKMGDSVTSIGSNAFVNCFSLEEIELSDSLTYIGSCAFEGCRSLKAIVIGGDDDSIDLLIGGSAFVDCPSLQSVVLGRSVSTLYGRAFNGCVSLYAVTFDGTVEEWQKVDCLIGWLDGSSITKVICTDGEVSVN